MKRFFALCALWSLALVAHPTPLWAGSEGNPLEAYLQQGLQANLVLKQRNVELAKAMNILEESRRLFLPNVNLNSGYTTGSGGRYIDLPVGDLLNPVYGTLNQLTNTSNFPQIKNVQSYFFPYNQFDAHVRTSVALVNPDLWYNRSIQKENAILKEYEVAIYQRELVKSIKTAFYNYLLAQANVTVSENALALVTKQLDNNRKKVAQGAALPATTHRLQAEHDVVESQLAGARNNTNNARNYFNFLLNLDPATPIKLDGFDADAALAEYSAQPTQALEREELKAINQGLRMTDFQLKMRNAAWIPRVNTFLDLGNQSANGLKVDNKSRYYLFGLTLDMPIFTAGTNSLKTKRAQLDYDALKLNKQNTEQGLALSALNAKNDVSTAKAQLTSSVSQNSAAKSYYTLAEKAYAGGALSFIEYLDARTQLTNSAVALNVAKFRVLQAYASLERETSQYALK